jgi:hypothetical protein
VPIVPFYHDQQDEELVHLASYLLQVASCDDMLTKNKEAFNLEQLRDSDLTSQNSLLGG